jgi:7SK snRNA methylphosphate capping enzyme
MVREADDQVKNIASLLSISSRPLVRDQHDLMHPPTPCVTHPMASASSSQESSSSSRRTWDSADQQHQPHLPQYGNYRGYYSIRREQGGEEKDSRLHSIFTWLNSRSDTKVLKRVLDVGCNNGQFTLQMCESLEGRSEEVFGVDIDRELVLLASSTARKTNKFTKTEEKVKVLGSGRVGRSQALGGPRKRLRLDDDPTQPLVARFLQSNWVYNDEMMQNRGDTCPQSMMPMQWDDMAEVSEQDEKGYNLILAMSVSKWVHINHYDTGLRRFFARVATCLAPGGIFIMEPQAYKSYKHTLKVTPPTSQPRRNFYALRVMPDDFAWILTVELGLEGPFCIREKGKDGE